MAVTLVVLRAIGIARPEDQHKRLVSRFEHRQYDLRGDIREIFLLYDVGDQRARLFEISRIGIVARRVFAGRGRQRQAR